MILFRKFGAACTIPRRQPASSSFSFVRISLFDLPAPQAYKQLRCLPCPEHRKSVSWGLEKFTLLREPQFPDLARSFCCSNRKLSATSLCVKRCRRKTEKKVSTGLLRTIGCTPSVIRSRSHDSLLSALWSSSAAAGRSVQLALLPRYTVIRCCFVNCVDAALAFGRPLHVQIVISYIE